MEEFTFDLVQVADGDADGTYKSRGDNGKRFPQLLVDSGTRTQIKGKLMMGIHGRLEEGGDPASLLIFEFNFTAFNGRRFKKATVTITFEDAKGPNPSDPEVYELAPSGFYTLNKETDTAEVTHGVDAAINANPIPAAGANVGYHWSMSQTKQKAHSATLNGMSRRVKSYGEETTAMWIIEEDPVKGEGIPTFLRAATLLRHSPDDCGKFRFTLEVDAVEHKNFFYGKSNLSRMIEPLDLDPKLLASHQLEGVDPENLGSQSLDSTFIVRLAQALTV